MVCGNKSKEKKWYNEICREAIKKRRIARSDFIRTGSQIEKNIFLNERKNCKRIIQREKRKFINGILEEAEKDRSQGKIRNFFKTIGRYKDFNPTLKAIKEKNGNTIMEPSDKAKRWREYFIDLLNAEIPVNTIGKAHYQTAELMISDITLDEVKVAINSLKNWKVPGSDDIPAELIKNGGEEMHKVIFKICQKTWEEEQMPEEWKKAVIIPIHKKGDKTECGNYRGISLLNSAYKVFSKVLLNRISPYIEENRGEYQCGFRKGRSTIEQITIIGRIIEKKYEYQQDLWQIFVDFKKAYDSVHRESLYNIMTEFGIPKKLRNLVRMCMEGAHYKVRIDQTISETFTVETGLKQGDALSPVLFNLALEKAVRELQKETTGIEINQQKIQILGFADDLNIIGNTKDDTEKAAKVLEKAAEKLGLKINTEKTKIMELLDMNTDFTDSHSNESIYEKVNEFKYLGVCINTKNDWSQEIGLRIKQERRHLHYPNFSKIKYYQRKQKLDSTQKFNKELVEETEMTPIKYYIRGQGIQWFGHIMREGDDKITKTVLSWKPTGKRPRGRPRKMWMDVVEEDLRIGNEDWRNIVHDREKWREVVMAAKTLVE
ncbi:hypothetical protein QTP88_022976 [Uroleucon formosanum]